MPIVGFIESMEQMMTLSRHDAQLIASCALFMNAAHQVVLNVIGWVL